MRGINTQPNKLKISDFEDKSLLILDDDDPLRGRLSRAMEKKGFIYPGLSSTSCSLLELDVGGGDDDHLVLDERLRALRHEVDLRRRRGRVGPYGVIQGHIISRWHRHPLYTGHISSVIVALR